MKDHTDTAELTAEFWDRIEDVRAGMLSTNTAQPRPMAHMIEDGDAVLWFITDKGTDIAEAAQFGTAATYTVACSNAKLYATVQGSLGVEHDAAKLDEIWSPMAAAWFEDGKSDDDVCLVRFTPTTAEVWTTDGGAKFLYEIAKANLTDTTPDVGEHGTITF